MKAQGRGRVIVFIVAALAACGGSTEPVALGPVEVDPRIGTGGQGYMVGSAFVGAAAPHGLAKAGPDTSGPKWGTLLFLHCSGYWAEDDTILGFSQLHLHGTGLPDQGVIGLMPLSDFDGVTRTTDDNASTFDKATEDVHPGYYAVTLDRGQIKVEITATTHASHYRFTFPASAPSRQVLLDLTHHLPGGEVRDFELAKTDDHTFVGHVRNVGDMSGNYGGHSVWFTLRANRPFASTDAWTEGALLDFGPGPEAIELQLGLSLSDAAHATANLDAEMPGFDFDGTRAATGTAWQDLVDSIRFEGGSAREQRMALAALYHLFLMPTIIQDVDGTFRAADDTLRKAEGYTYVSDLSLWDTYRTLHPMYALIAPSHDLDAVRSLGEMARGLGYYPKWPLGPRETGVMTGAGAEVVLADAYSKGIRDFDAEGAYQVLRAAALDLSPELSDDQRGGRQPVRAYAELGFLPADEVSGSVSKTTEQAYDDFALSRLARALGHDADADLLAKRSLSYRNLYDPSSGFLAGKTRAGSFLTTSLGPTAFTNEFVEANAWQTLFYAPHDIDGLSDLLGGRDALVAKLETFFEEARKEWESIGPKDVIRKAIQRPYYWASNEPDIQAGFMFAQAGRPDLTQKWVRWAADTFYGDGPDGLPGNDDGGTMSAWFLFSSLGLYPLPGTDEYIVGAPRFTRASVRVEGGTFTIEAPAASAKNLYVKSLTLDGVPVTRPELRHEDLRAGSTLRFELVSTPTDWGRQ